MAYINEKAGHTATAVTNAEANDLGYWDYYDEYTKVGEGGSSQAIDDYLNKSSPNEQDMTTLLNELQKTPDADVDSYKKLGQILDTIDPNNTDLRIAISRARTAQRQAIADARRGGGATQAKAKEKLTTALGLGARQTAAKVTLPTGTPQDIYKEYIRKSLTRARAIGKEPLVKETT